MRVDLRLLLLLAFRHGKQIRRYSHAMLQIIRAEERVSGSAEDLSEIFLARDKIRVSKMYI